MKNEYEIRGDVTIIFVKSKKHGKYEVKISTNKLDILKQIEGKCYIQKNLRAGHTYASVAHPETKKAIALHRFILGNPADMHVDHINRDTLDNTDDNLRIVTHAENQQNRKIHRDNKSGVRGVFWVEKMKKWRAMISINNKSHHIGYYNSLAEADSAARKARAEIMKFCVEAV